MIFDKEWREFPSIRELRKKQTHLEVCSKCKSVVIIEDLFSHYAIKHSDTPFDYGEYEAIYYRKYPHHKGVAI